MSLTLHRGRPVTPEFLSMINQDAQRLLGSKPWALRFYGLSVGETFIGVVRRTRRSDA